MKRIIIALCAILLLSHSTLYSSADWQHEDDKTYYLNGNGEYITGWKTIDGKRYYFNKNGVMLTKNTVINHIRYQFDANGVCQGTYTGWTKSLDGKKYYKNGKYLTGWQKTKSNKHYYFGDSGILYTGEKRVIDGKVYNFNQNGFWDGKTPKKFTLPCYPYVHTSIGKVSYNGKMFYIYDWVEHIHLSEIKYAGKISKTVENPNEMNNFEANSFPEGTKIYAAASGELVAINEQSMFAECRITLLSTNEEKAYAYFNKLSHELPEKERYRALPDEWFYSEYLPILYYAGESIVGGTYIPLTAYHVEGIKTLEYLGEINKYAWEPQKDFESNSYPIGTKLYRYLDNSFVIVQRMGNGTELAELVYLE